MHAQLVCAAGERHEKHAGDSFFMIPGHHSKMGHCPLSVFNIYNLPRAIFGVRPQRQVDDAPITIYNTGQLRHIFFSLFPLC